MYATHQKLEEESEGCPVAVAPNHFGTRDLSWKTISPWTRMRRMVLGGSKCIAFIVHFISIITTSAPPQITRHLIPEVGDLCLKDF